jgi:hypothetical protein
MIREWHPSPNWSYRDPGGVRLITVHTSEGATTNQSLANFITQASAQVSYHVSVDNWSGGNFCYEYVDRLDKSWSQASYNPVAVTGCFCTPSGASSGWSRSYWLDNQMTALTAMAAWVGEESRHWGIPLVALSDGQAQGGGRGVCQHANLGAGGSGHHDCGPGFPVDVLLDLAAGGGSKPPERAPYPSLVPGEETMNVVFGSDRKASLGLPRNATHLRLTSAQPVRVDAIWPGGANRASQLDSVTRADVPMEGNGTGIVTLTRETGSEAVVYATWVVSA